DLMLLENQVPFLVLQALFDCTMGKASSVLLPEKISTTDVGSDHDHLLGYLHKRYQLVVAKSSNPIHTEESKLLDEKGLENT
ncbi:putative UPF0481 protein, partial [Tanacetum coccineum]